MLFSIGIGVLLGIVVYPVTLGVTWILLLREGATMRWLIMMPSLRLFYSHNIKIPIREEFLYRLLPLGLITLLTDRMLFILPVVLVSSFVFSLYHPPPWESIRTFSLIFYFFVGILLSSVFLWQGFFSALALHMTHNTLILFCTLWGFADDPDDIASE